jgi:hypothetical protein
MRKILIFTAILLLLIPAFAQNTPIDKVTFAGQKYTLQDIPLCPKDETDCAYYYLTGETYNNFTKALNVTRMANTKVFDIEQDIAVTAKDKGIKSYRTEGGDLIYYNWETDFSMDTFEEILVFKINKAAVAQEGGLYLLTFTTQGDPADAAFKTNTEKQSQSWIKEMETMRVPSKKGYIVSGPAPKGTAALAQRSAPAAIPATAHAPAQTQMPQQPAALAQQQVIAAQASPQTAAPPPQTTADLKGSLSAEITAGSNGAAKPAQPKPAAQQATVSYMFDGEVYGYLKDAPCPIGRAELKNGECYVFIPEGQTAKNFRKALATTFLPTDVESNYTVLNSGIQRMGDGHTNIKEDSATGGFSLVGWTRRKGGSNLAFEISVAQEDGKGTKAISFIYFGKDTDEVFKSQAASKGQGWIKDLRALPIYKGKSL